MNKRAEGSAGEIAAAVYLEQHGVRIIDKNYRFHKLGEIDLIGEGESSMQFSSNEKGVGVRTLIFVEVKKRSGLDRGYAAQAVDSRKQRQICRVAGAYLMEHPECANMMIRFDVIAIDGDELTWIQNAFEYHI